MCPLYLLSVVLEAYARAIRYRKFFKRHTNRKGRSQIILYADKMVLHLANLMTHQKTLSKVGYKVSLFIEQ